MEDGNRAASGSMSNGEIEDVLDSIRRLVAQSSSAVAVGAARGRLILTPAFRVDQHAAADAYCDAGSGLSTRAGIATEARFSAVAPVATQMEAVAPYQEELDPDAGSGVGEADAGFGSGSTRAWPGEEESPADIAARRAEIATRTAAEVATLDALRRVVARDGTAARAATTSPGPDPSDGEGMRTQAAAVRPDAEGDEQASRILENAATDEDPTEALERTIAELEAAIAASAEDWDPDGSEHGDLVGLSSPTGSSPHTGFEDRTDRSAGGVLQPHGTVPDHPEDRASAPDATGNSDGVAGAELPKATAPMDPHAPARDQDGPESYNERIGAEATSAADASDAEEWSDDLAAAEMDAVIDEDMLRDLVARIVREELQGRLGERITRNVRKLVRAEIARALAERPYS